MIRNSFNFVTKKERFFLFYFSSLAQRIEKQATSIIYTHRIIVKYSSKVFENRVLEVAYHRYLLSV